MKQLQGNKKAGIKVTVNEGLFCKCPTYALKTGHDIYMEMPLLVLLESQFHIIEDTLLSFEGIPRNVLVIVKHTCVYNTHSF